MQINGRHIYKAVEATHKCECGNVHPYTYGILDEDAYWSLNYMGETDEEGGFWYAKNGFTLAEATTHRRLQRELAQIRHGSKKTKPR